MEFSIGQGVIKIETAVGKATKVYIAFPFKVLQLEVAMRFAPDSPAGQVFGIDIQISERRNVIEKESVK